MIQTQRELMEFCERMRSAHVICLDTEFAGEGRYYREVGTIQVAAEDEVELIDPLAVRELSPLLPALTSPGIVKVFHAGEQDLEIFYRLLGRPVVPIFDTQVAAALLGYGDQISFRSLLEIATGVRLEKGHTFTDWLRRPLSGSQIEYALDDVRYLGRIYERVERELCVKGRLDWAREEFGEFEKAERFVPAEERQLYLRMKGAGRLPLPALGVLQELAAWRELTARRLNMPPGRIVMDPVLVELARRPRYSVRELAEIRGLNPRQIQKFGAAIIEVLRRGVTNTPPSIKRATSLPAGLEPTVDFLSLCLRALAVEQSISAGILANRTDLARLAALGQRAQIGLLRGWRRQAVGVALLEALEGKVVARVVAPTREVHLEWQLRAGERPGATMPGPQHELPVPPGQAPRDDTSEPSANLTDPADD